MARRKKKNASGGGLFGAIFIALVLITMVPTEVWVALGVLLSIAGGIWIYTKSKAPQTGSSPAPPPIAAETTPKGRPRRSAAKTGPAQAYAGEPLSGSDTLTLSRSPRSPTASPTVEFDAPPTVKAPAKARATSARKAAGRWVPPGSSVTVQGLSLPMGMLYVGGDLGAPSGGADPCLVDPDLSVDFSGDFITLEMGYWPSYSEISPAARGAYLKWLADGRRHPRADIGYVFLFFYGLERRAILDGPSLGTRYSDGPAIAEEIRRLLSIYGERSVSFRRYAADLLDWVMLVDPPRKLYLQPVPHFAEASSLAGLPLHLRLALGQTAIDGVPVSAPLALAWARLDDRVTLRTPATRLPDKFAILFQEKYTELCGGGIRLPHNHTRLKRVCRPASAGLRGHDALTLSYGDMPDVTVLTEPIHHLQAAVDAATEPLASYSRAVGNDLEGQDTLDRLIHLPVTLWPVPRLAALTSLKSRMGDGLLALRFGELLQSLGAQAAFTKEKTKALARALESAQIGLVPDLLTGSRVPLSNELVVLFTMAPGKHETTSAHYPAALLTVQIAAAVAAADGSFSIEEVRHLRTAILSWNHLPPNDSRRLLAQLRLMMSQVPTVAQLKRHIEPLDAEVKETVASFMVSLVHSDGEVAPAEVTMLQKVYAALGLDPQQVFSHLHALSAGAPAALQPVRPASQLLQAPEPAIPATTSVAAPTTYEVPRFVPTDAQVPAAVPPPDVQRAPDQPIQVEVAALPAQATTSTEFKVPARPEPPPAPPLENPAPVTLDTTVAAVTPAIEPTPSVKAAPEEAVLPRAPQVSTPPKAPSFKLDLARVAALQKDTARVHALLANIFRDDEEEEAESTADAPTVDDAGLAVPEAAPAGMLGLDEAHASLARMMLSRPEWSRSELLQVAEDLDLMLDGALEALNEAAFEAHDLPFFEGEDPVTVNNELLEIMEA